jgi:hypothetical protein
MIRIFTGTDNKKAKIELNKAVKMTGHDSTRAIHHFSDVNFEPTSAIEAISSASLFFDVNIVIFEGIFAVSGGSEFLLKSAKQLCESKNDIFIFEEKIPADLLEALSKGSIVYDYPLKKASFTGEKFNNFAIANALAARDKRAAWVSYQSGIRAGAKAEELHGVVSWGVKTMLITRDRTREESVAAGVSQNSYGQYKNGSKNYLSGELEEMLGELKDMYHDSHSGGPELEQQLEQFLLKI